MKVQVGHIQSVAAPSCYDCLTATRKGRLKHWVGILCATGDGAVPPPPLQARAALLPNSLMQTQIVAHTQTTN